MPDLLLFIDTVCCTSCCFVVAQVLLHSSEEKPRMEEMGFAVAPGKHTLVAVKATQVC